MTIYRGALDAKTRYELVDICVRLAVIDGDSTPLEETRSKMQSLTRQELIETIMNSPHEVPQKETPVVSLKDRPTESLSKNEAIELYLDLRIAVANNESECWREIDRWRYKYAELGAGMRNAGYVVGGLAALYIYSGAVTVSTWMFFILAALAVLFGFGATSTAFSSIRDLKDPNPSRVVGSYEEEFSLRAQVLEKLEGLL